MKRPVTPTRPQRRAPEAMSSKGGVRSFEHLMLTKPALGVTDQKVGGSNPSGRPAKTRAVAFVTSYAETESHDVSRALGCVRGHHHGQPCVGKSRLCEPSHHCWRTIRGLVGMGSARGNTTWHSGPSDNAVDVRCRGLTA
jgi:hypothetical protein